MSREYHESNEEKRENIEVQEDGLLDISGYVDAAWKGCKRCWMWFLVIISFCSTVGWMLARQIYVPSYVASTTFVVETNTAYAYSAEAYNKATASQMSKTFPYIISNSAMQHLIEEDLGVDEIPGTIAAEAMNGTNLITLKVTASEAKLAYDILQSVIKNFPTIGRAVIGDTQMKIVEESGVPQAPVNSANYRSAAKKGFLAGVAVCIAWMALYVMTRRTICREEDLKTILNIRCLATVPKVQFKKRHSTKKNLVLLDNARVSNSFKEAYRTIRARVERTMNEKGSSVFLVSSANAGEGKTTVAVNLALSMAEKGKKVILMDLDLRNPSVMRTFGVREKRVGIAEVLQGKVPLNEVMESYGNLDLRIVPGGKPVQLTSKLLTSQALDVIFRVLRSQADCVIIDTPPSGLLSDAALIAHYADAGIFVVRQDYTAVERIKEGIEMLTDTELPLVGCVLNYTQAGITGYGYGYGYGKYGYTE